MLRGPLWRSLSFIDLPFGTRAWSNNRRFVVQPCRAVKVGLNVFPTGEVKSKRGSSEGGPRSFFRRTATLVTFSQSSDCREA